MGYTINSPLVSCSKKNVSFGFRSTKGLLKMPLGKLSSFADEKKLRSIVSQVKGSPHAKIPLFFEHF